MKDKRVYVQIVVNLLITIVTALIVIFVIPPLLKAFWPFAVGLIVSMIANPLVKYLESKWKILRKHSSAIVIVLVIVVIVLFIYGIFSLLIAQIVRLFGDVNSIYDSISTALVRAGEVLKDVFVLLPGNVQDNLNGFSTDVNTIIKDWITGIKLPNIGDASGYVKNIVEFLFMAIITVLAAYFFIAERDNMVTVLAKIVPQPVIDYYTIITQNFKKAVGGYFKVQFKLMFFIWAILFVGFLFMGTSYAFLLSLLVAFLDLLPVLGTGTVLGPWVVISLLTGKYMDALYLTLLYITCQLVKQLLQPKMVGDSVGMNPFATLVFMFIGYKIGGVMGLIIGIPIGMVLISLYKVGLFDRLMRGLNIIIHDINEFRKY